MKKKLLFTCFYAFAIVNTVNAQSNWTYTSSGSGPISTNANTTDVVIDGTSKLGINTTSSPTYPLTINGDMGFESSSVLARQIFGRSSNNGLLLHANTTWNDGGNIILNGNSGSDPASIGIISGNICNGCGSPHASFNVSNWDPGAGTWVNRLLINNDGNVGINTNALYDKLSINGDIGFTPTSSSVTFRAIKGRSPNAGLLLYANTGWSDGAGIMLQGNSGSEPGLMTFVSSNIGGGGASFLFTTADPVTGSWTNRMLINRDGKIAIGENITNTALPGNYRLYVQDGILTEKLKVAIAATSDWSDYVFAKDYKLKALSEIENYVNSNKHLPDVPSAEQVKTEGIDVATMDAKLLQKIEELTLYAIQQQKQIDELKRKLDK